MKKLQLIVILLLLSFTSQFAIDQKFRSAGNGGNWTDLLKWEKSTDGGDTWHLALEYPTASNSSAITIRMEHNIIWNGTEVIADQVVVNSGATLTITGGTLENGTGDDLVCNGELIIQGQLIGNNNCTVVINNTIRFDGVPAYVGGMTITNNGNAFILDGKTAAFNGNFIFNNAGTFYSECTSGTENSIAINIYNPNGNQFNNNSGATFQKMGTGITSITVPFYNTGTVSLEKGAITINNDVTGSGTYTLTSGTTLNFSSGNGTGVSTISEGAVFNGTGNVNISRTVNSSGTTNGITFGSGITLGLNGILGGDGNLTVNGILNWTYGTMSGSGYRNFAFGSVLNVNTSSTVYLTGGTLANYGTLNFVSGYLALSTGVQLENNATCNVTDTFILSRQAEAICSFVNTGTFNVNAGSGKSFGSYVQFENDGTTNISSGSLEMRNDLHLKSGSLNNSSGTLIFPNTVKITRSTGTISNTPTFSSNINLEYTGSILVTTGNEMPTGASILTDLTIANSGGVILGSSITINQNLNLTSGRLLIGNNNLTLVGSVVGTIDASNMVVTNGSGEFRKRYYGSGSFTFPIGDNSGTAEYSPLDFNLTSYSALSSAYVGAKVTNSKHTSNTSTTNYLNRYWTLIANGITSPQYNATFNYKDADINGTEAGLYGAKHDGSNWTLFSNVNSANNTFQVTGLTSFSDFTAGEQSALPVELISFFGEIVNRKIVMNWQTATEVNNYGFEVERNNILHNNWEKIGFVRGHGNSNSLKIYSFTDANPPNGKIKYRLKQIDFDGKYEYSDEIEVFIEGPVTYTLEQNQPNPFNPETIIKYSIPNNEFVTLKVYDMLGKEITNLVNEQKPAGNYSVSFYAKGIASGVYLYKLNAGKFQQTNKMLLLK